jgi:hypothetical protein
LGLKDLRKCHCDATTTSAAKISIAPKASIPKAEANQADPRSSKLAAKIANPTTDRRNFTVDPKVCPNQNAPS